MSTKNKNELFPPIEMSHGPINKFLHNSDASPPWIVQNDSIPTLPFWYPLQKTHALVHGATPFTIASRISECMKELFIVVVYDNEKATAKAETADHTKFVIKLYLPPEHEDKTGVILECQRLSGSTISFHNSYRVILRASKGLIGEGPCTRTLRSFSGSITKLAKYSKHKISQMRQENITDVLSTADTMLKKDRIDANVLGMESLRMITDPSKTRFASALHVAKVILDKGSEYNDIREKLIALVKYWRLSEDVLEEPEDDFDRRHFEIMHNHALAVFANSLTLLASGGILNDVVSSQSWLGDELAMVLIEEVKESETRPHNAYLSARCLNALVGVSSEVRVMAMELKEFAHMRISQPVYGQESKG